VVIWYIFYVLVCLDKEKSGNPGCFCTYVNALVVGLAPEVINEENFDLDFFGRRGTDNHL
jgi:hypothetical protein